MRFILAFACTLTLFAAACSQSSEEQSGDLGETEIAIVREPVQTETAKLTPDGLSILAEGSDRPAIVTFGTSRGETERILTGGLGSPISENQPNDCGLTSTHYEGLALHFRDDLFVGYFANAPYVPEKTKAEMLDDPDVTLLADSTIDGEFTMGPQGDAISGIFVGDEVRGMWAGENCIAR